MEQIPKVTIWRWILLLFNNRIALLGSGEPVYSKCVFPHIYESKQKGLLLQIIGKLDTWHFPRSKMIRFLSHQRFYLMNSNKLACTETASLTLFFVNTRTFDFPVPVKIRFDTPCPKRASFINNIKLFRDDFSEDVTDLLRTFLLVWWDVYPSNAPSVWNPKATFKKIALAQSAGYVIKNI